MSTPVGELLHALGPAAVVPPLAIAVTVVLMVHQFRRVAEGRRGLQRLCSVARDPDAVNDSTLRHYLQPGVGRVAPGDDERLLLRLGRREMLDELMHRSQPWGIASIFTGFALCITFGLIGHVLVTQIQAALASFSGPELGSSGDARLALNGASASLANGVAELGAKFFISATGVFCSIVYAWAESRCRASCRLAVDGAERELQAVLASPGEYDAVLQRRHLQALMDLSTKVERLSSIEVSVQDLSSQVMLELSRTLTADMGSQIKGILEQTLGEVNKIADKACETLSSKLESAVGVVERRIPEVVEHLEAIRGEVARQAQAPVEALMERFQSALSGGYQSQASQLGSALDQLSKTIPDMARSLEAAGRHITEAVGAERERGREVQQQLVVEMDAMLGRLEGQQTAVADLVGHIRGEAAATAADLGSSLKQQLEAATAGFSQLADGHTRAMNERLSGMLEAQQSGFDELAAKVALVARALDQSERALAGSATHLSVSAQQVGTAQAANDRLIAGTTSMVSAVQRSTDELNQNAKVVNDLLLRAKDIVQEATKHAVTEADLTKQLQAVWPQLLERYLRSFQEKSDALASSWTTTHEKVAALTGGVVDQLQAPVEDLRAAVDDLAKALKPRLSAVP